MDFADFLMGFLIFIVGLAIGLIVGIAATESTMIHTLSEPDEAGFVGRGVVQKTFDGVLLEETDGEEYVIGTEDNIVFPDEPLNPDDHIDIDFRDGQFVVTCVNCNTEEPREDTETTDSLKGPAPERGKQ